MQFGLLYEMETPRPWNKLSEYNVYHEALAQIERADQVGFDYVWEVEHHFLEEYSHSPAPEVFYGAVSQRTKNIRIAHGVRLLPHRFNHPIKVAEQAAVLDILSNGRMDLGTGPVNHRPGVWTALGWITTGHVRRCVRPLDVIVESLDRRNPGIQRQNHSGPTLAGSYPNPFRSRTPPMWMACVAPDSYEMAADRGLGVLSFNLNWEQVQEDHGNLPREM